MICRILVIAILFTAPLGASAQQRKSKPPGAAQADGGRLCLRQGLRAAEVRLLAGEVRQADAGRGADSRRRLGARATRRAMAGGIQPFLDAGISVAAINYRFIPQAMEQKVEPPVKACLSTRPGRCRRFAPRPRNGTSIRSASARPAAPPAPARRCGSRCTTTWPIPRATTRSRGSPRG